MGIDTEQHNNKKTITALEAHEMYLAIEGNAASAGVLGTVPLVKVVSAEE
jgi:hypothetical protein